MGGKSSTASSKSSGEPPPASIMIKKTDELIVVDTLLEEGLNDGDLPHLCLDKTLLINSGHSTLGPDELEDVLNSVRKSKRKLNKLSVMFNGTQAHGIGRFLASDRSVRELTILCENISQESIQSISEALKSNDRVVKVFLGGRELRREAAVALGGMLEVTPSLQQLTLFNCGIGDDGSRHLAIGLAANKTLQFLDLTYCRIMDEGAVAIARAVQEHSFLSHLNLKSNIVRVRGASALAQVLRNNIVVQELMLGGNKIRDAGAETLGGAVAVNTTLVCLDLGANEITDKGGLAIAEGLAHNASLRNINLRRNRIGSEMCERIRAGWNKRNAKESMRRDQPWHDGLSLPA